MEDHAEMAENKIMILYALNKADGPVSCTGLTNMMLELKLMNYFTLQESIHELTGSGCIKTSDSDGRSSFIITDQGREMTGFFSSRIPGGVKKRLTEKIGEFRDDIYQRSLVIADHREIDVDMFEVELVIRERSADLMDLRLLAGSKAEAMRICDKFKENYQEIYRNITGYFTV
jgi:predicted transcriptional regulator